MLHQIHILYNTILSTYFSDHLGMGNEDGINHVVPKMRENLANERICVNHPDNTDSHPAPATHLFIKNVLRDYKGIEVQVQ